MTVMPVNENSIYMLKGRLEINYHMKILLERIAHKSNQKILLIAQSDNTFLMDVAGTWKKSTGDDCTANFMF